MTLISTPPVKELEYDEKSNELKVTFSNNKQFAYQGVPQNIVNELEISSSMGEFFANNIQSQYEGKKVTEADQLLLS